MKTDFSILENLNKPRMTRDDLDVLKTKGESMQLGIPFSDLMKIKGK